MLVAKVLVTAMMLDVMMMKLVVVVNMVMKMK